MSGLGRRAILFGSGCLFTGARADAADYPSRPVRIVVPYPAGGSNDIVARILAQKLAERHGTGFVVDNRAGANGNIGAKIVVDSEPSGYTLLLTAPPPLTINNALYADIRYDAETDFSPVAIVASVPIVLTVSASLRVDTVQELIALARAKPGSINFGSAGVGSTGHLAGQLFKAKTGIDIVHVPYRGEAPAIIDLIAGSTQMMFNNLPSVLPQVLAKTVKILAVAGATRARTLPDIPTIAESGVPGFAASAWFGLVAPAKTPKTIVDALIADVSAILRDPETQTRLASIGAEPGTMSGDAFRQALAAERLTWGAIIVASGAKADQ